MLGFLRSFSILVLTAGCSLATLLAARLFGGPAPERVMGWWGRAFVRLGGFRLRVEGLEELPPGGAVLVVNHQSLVDIPLLLTAFGRPVKFLAKRELGEIPLFGKAMAAAGNLFVDREDPRDAVHMLRDAGARVRGGSLLVVFPEGTRSADGSIGEFKPGAFYLAQKSGAPVVPVYIDGGNRALPKGSIRFRPADLLVRVLPPITAEEGAGGPKERIAASVRERIVQERNRVNSPTGEGAPPGGDIPSDGDIPSEGDIPGSSTGRREGVSPASREGGSPASGDGVSSARKGASSAT